MDEKLEFLVRIGEVVVAYRCFGPQLTMTSAVTPRLKRDIIQALWKKKSTRQVKSCFDVEVVLLGSLYALFLAAFI